MSCTMKSFKDEFLKMCDSQGQAAFEECGSDMEYYAKRACPVDTGRLHNSITHEVDGCGSGIKAIVGTNVEYAQYVEDGTYRMAARPYIKPSVSDHISHYQSVIKKYLNG